MDKGALKTKLVLPRKTMQLIVTCVWISYFLKIALEHVHRDVPVEAKACCLGQEFVFLYHRACSRQRWWTAVDVMGR